MTDETQVRITIREIWNAQQEQQQLLARLASKIEQFLEQHDRLDTVVADHETRIRTLEKRAWQAFGAVALAGATIGTIVNLILN